MPSSAQQTNLAMTHYPSCLPLTSPMTIHSSRKHKPLTWQICRYLREAVSDLFSQQKLQQCLNKPHHTIENFPIGIIMQGKTIPHCHFTTCGCSLSKKDAWTCRLKQLWKTTCMSFCPLRSLDLAQHISHCLPQQYSFQNQVFNKVVSPWGTGSKPQRTGD